MNTLEASTLNWKIRPKASLEDVNRIVAAIENLHPVVAQILVQRGFNTYETVKDFLLPPVKN